MITATSNQGIVEEVKLGPDTATPTLEEAVTRKLAPTIVESLKYRKERFERDQAKAYTQKYNLALLLEAIEANNLASDEELELLGFNVDQINALLDWKQEFDEYEQEKSIERENIVEDMNRRAEERKLAKKSSAKALRESKKSKK